MITVFVETVLGRCLMNLQVIFVVYGGVELICFALSKLITDLAA